MKQFGGSVLFLDRSDINTDEIIPAKYLTEISMQALKPYIKNKLDVLRANASGVLQELSLLVPFLTMIPLCRGIRG